jgi:uncharacterized protein (TIGR02266 family)
MTFGKLLGQSPKREIIHRDIRETKALIHMDGLEKAFVQISSVINAHKDLNKILEVIVQESLKCLKAHRSTIFLLDEKSGALKTQFTHVSDPLSEQVGLNEEREVARKTLQQNGPSLLRGPEDFSTFFKYDERKRKITSLMSIPISFQGKTNRILSAVLINEEYSFDEKTLQFFSSFANYASIAIENAHLLEEVRKGESFRIIYERYLDNILNQLQSLHQKEQERIESHLVELPAEQKIDQTEILEGQTTEELRGVRGTITLIKESGLDRRKDERVELIVRVEFEEEYWGFTKNLSKGGAFILTPDPLELGDEFLLKIHMPDGREPIEVACKVTWTNQYAKETTDLRKGMGVKFLDLRPESKKRVEEYIQSHKDKNLLLKN